MKYLRTTIWIGHHAEPMTTIVPESDLRIPIYAAATQHRILLGAVPGPVVEVEVHELEDALSLPDAVLKIIASRPEPLTPEQRHELTAYEWGMALLTQMNPGGVAQTTLPAPLSVEALTRVLKRLAAASNYRDQTFNMTSQDLVEVSLSHGEVRTSRPA